MLHAIAIGAFMGCCRLQCDVLFWLQIVGSLTEMVTGLRAERRRSMEVSFKRNIALLWSKHGAKEVHTGSCSHCLVW